MKKIFYSLLACLASFSAFAQPSQPDHWNEISINGGGSFFTIPQGTLYKGEEAKITYAAGLSYQHYITPQWSLGLEGMMTEWKNNSSTIVNGSFDTVYGRQPLGLTYADRAYGFTLKLNRVVPQYNQWHYLRANFYYGVSAGVQFTESDGLLTYAQVDNQNGRDRKYVSDFHYEPAMGWVAGVQLGYIYYLNDYFGLNIEGSARFTKLYNNDIRYDKASNSYTLFYFPVTAGIRFRF